MGLLSIVLLVIFAIAALLMILVIMLQDDQGEGIGGLFGGGSSSAFGSRSGNILTRFTSILGAIFIVGAFALAWLNRTSESSDIVERARLEQIQAAEESNWWVERIEEPEPSMQQLETESESEEESELPGGMNR
ncbi:MAG: preprotein translocase subunit SecG [Spirochaetales bacterium]|nr:preprotein translocase subunit SecG [Spirochaetales bacterium]